MRRILQRTLLLRKRCTVYTLCKSGGIHQVAVRDIITVATLAEGRDWSVETSSARNWSPPQTKVPLASVHRGGGYSSQENRYVGFGNTVNSQRKEEDFFNNAMTSIYSGWSNFTVGASKFALAAKENATELSQSINENVIKPTQEKVKEGKLFDDVASSMSHLASKVQGAGTKGWKDMSTFFSGKPEDSSNRPAMGDSYQNSSIEESYQNSGLGNQEFWENFGSESKTKKSPSNDSWTYADNNSTEKKSLDSWDNWGSEAVSKNNHSTGESWETWDNNWDAAGEGKAKKSPKKTAKVANDDAWDNQNW
ncbi:ARFG1 protein, partial [Polypterus senegalus]